MARLSNASNCLSNTSSISTHLRCVLAISSASSIMLILVASQVETLSHCRRSQVEPVILVAICNNTKRYIRHERVLDACKTSANYMDEGLPRRHAWVATSGPLSSRISVLLVSFLSTLDLLCLADQRWSHIVRTAASWFTSHRNMPARRKIWKSKLIVGSLYIVDLTVRGRVCPLRGKVLVTCSTSDGIARPADEYIWLEADKSLGSADLCVQSRQH